MAKKKDVIYFDLDDEFDYTEEEFPEEDQKALRSKSRRRHRLKIKKRMDDYEEYLWKKRNGWFDDELYSGLDEENSMDT